MYAYKYIQSCVYTCLCIDYYLFLLTVEVVADRLQLFKWTAWQSLYLNPCSTSRTYRYICVCVYIHTYLYMHICKHTYSCTHIYMCALFALAYLKIWESRVTRLRECKYTNVYIYIYICSHAYTDSQRLSATD